MNHQHQVYRRLLLVGRRRCRRGVSPALAPPHGGQPSYRVHSTIEPEGEPPIVVGTARRHTGGGELNLQPVLHWRSASNLLAHRVGRLAHVVDPNGHHTGDDDRPAFRQIADVLPGWSTSGHGPWNFNGTGGRTLLATDVVGISRAARTLR